MLNSSVSARKFLFGVHFIPICVDKVVLDLIDSVEGLFVELPNVKAAAMP